MSNPNPSGPDKQATDAAAAQKLADEAAAKKAADDAAAAQKLADEAAAKKEKAQKVEAPAWQLPDYAGPLDINQAQWRVGNIKPVRGTAKK